jgi:LysM repeat protein
MFHFSRSLRTFLGVCLALVMITSLAACTLSASDAPTIGEETTIPLPEDESIFDEQATQVVILPEDETGGGQEQPELPAATATPVPETQTEADVPAQEQPAAQVLEPTEGPPPATYTLQKGEFPFCIARRFDLNQAELLALNGMNLNSKPGVGTTLKLPQTGNHFVTDRSLKDHPTTYTVSAGDTIYTVACKFGDVSPDMIALANDLDEPYTLSSGQTLNIP